MQSNPANSTTALQVYKMPVEFAVYSQGEKTVFRNGLTGGSFIDSMATQTFTVKFASQPDSVVFDPDNRIMKQIVPWSDTLLPYSSFSLNNFPNPFKSVTEITYVIPVGTTVDLDIYDVLGRKVKTYDEGYEEANTYTLRFDAHTLASGVYFCRLSTDFENRTLKLLLEK